MFAIVGILLVFGSVIGGFLMERGHIAVLLQPAEFLIIVGAGLGTLLVANPPHTLKAIASSVPRILKKSRYTKARYISVLQMMFALLNKVRRAGMLSIESDIEQPEESLIFKEHADFLGDHHAVAFVCDTMRMVVTGGVDPFDMDQMMDLDMEVQHRCAHQPVSSLMTAADSLPGLGIVAAVLGVVITMGALGGPAAEIGRKVAAALVGTFLGILLCYGVVGPIGAFLSKEAEEEHAFLYVMRVLMVSFIKGNAPLHAIEIARRAVPMHVRPTFLEVEAACQGRRQEQGEQLQAGEGKTAEQVA